MLVNVYVQIRIHLSLIICIGDNFYKSATYTFEVLSAASFVNEKENLRAIETHISAKRTEISMFENEYRQVGLQLHIINLIRI